VVALFYFLFSLSGGVAISSPGGSGNGRQTATLDRPEPSRADVSRAISLSARYLERACGPNGKFTYSIDSLSGRENRSYNIVRHAGAIYALAMLNRFQREQEAIDVMVRASGFLRQRYIGSAAHPDQLAVWSKPLGDRSEASLGATGLGLVALTETKGVRDGAVALSDLQRLGNFLLFLQTKDGSFVHKYRLESGLVMNEKVLYYPGEAALGLIELYKRDHSRKWLVGASYALSYLAKSRAHAISVPHDNWALIATSELLPLCAKQVCPVSRQELMRHAARICESIVHEQLRNPSAPLDGAYDPAGRTALVATRMEGLLASLEFLPHGKLRSDVEATVGRGIAFLLRCQISSGTFAGGMPAAFPMGQPNASEVRIDYVQHALCAWIRYVQLGDLHRFNRQTSLR
jgi:hypothetical protein